MTRLLFQLFVWLTNKIDSGIEDAIQEINQLGGTPPPACPRCGLRRAHRHKDSV